MLVSTTGFVACLALGLVCCQDMKVEKAVRDSLLSGLIFTENLLFERSVTSKIGCASLCSKTDHCVTFTFTPVTSADDVCRGHSARMTLCKAHQASDGTKLYAFREDPKNETAAEDWLAKVCTSAQDCSQPNSRCRRCKCTCTQGYYYSVSTKACLDSCSPEDLQDTYLPYPGAVTYDGVGTRLLNSSLEECRQGCTDQGDCINFEFYEIHRQCYLVTINPRDKSPSLWNDNNPGWTHNQRNCR